MISMPYRRGLSTPHPTTLREATFFVDRLSQEGMPLAGLVLNRTHPMLCPLTVERAIDGATELEASPDGGGNDLTAAVLRIHADRGQTAKREVRLLARFTGANPHVPVVGVPSLPFDVSDMNALQAIADQITGET
jgi:anion-transporting  ArsA/GET3 family ATPase